MQLIIDVESISGLSFKTLTGKKRAGSRLYLMLC